MFRSATSSSPQVCPGEVYEARVGEAVGALREEGVRCFAFGDLLLEDVRRHREALLAHAGAAPLFPLWGEPSA